MIPVNVDRLHTYLLENFRQLYWRRLLLSYVLELRHQRWFSVDQLSTRGLSSVIGVDSYIVYYK
jgi:hypothetical protein